MSGGLNGWRHEIPRRCPVAPTPRPLAIGARARRASYPDLPGKNATTDAEIVANAVAENRAIITKDDDFVQSFLLTGAPPKLLLISTGNIGNAALEAIFQKNLTAMVAAFDSAAFIELSLENLIIHG